MLIVQADSREQRNEEVLRYFDSVGQKYVISKLYAGDYCNLNHPTILVDLKKDVLEVINNVTKDHDRFKDEIRRANEDMNCKLVVLIREPLSSLEDIKIYKVPVFGKWYKDKEKRGKPRSAMNTETLYKIMKTMQDKYNLEWQFCTRDDAGKRIIEILGE